MWGKFGKIGKWSSNEKAKIVDRGSLCYSPESTGSKVEYELYLFLDRVIHFGVNLRDQVKGRSQKKIKSLIEIP